MRNTAQGKWTCVIMCDFANNVQVPPHCTLDYCHPDDKWSMEFGIDANGSFFITEGEECLQKLLAGLPPERQFVEHLQVESSQIQYQVTANGHSVQNLRHYLCFGGRLECFKNSSHFSLIKPGWVCMLDWYDGCILCPSHLKRPTFVNDGHLRSKRHRDNVRIWMNKRIEEFLAIDRFLALIPSPPRTAPPLSEMSSLRPMQPRSLRPISENF